MGVDVCYTNHAEADQNDMDTLLTLLGVAGVNFVMGVPGSDDIMLNYQSTSYHDARLCARRARPSRRARVRAWRRISAFSTATAVSRRRAEAGGLETLLLQRSRLLEAS